MTETKSLKRSSLIACSDEWMCKSLQTLFQEKGYSATRISSGKEALQLARRNGFDVVLLDESVDELPAVDVCLALRDDPLFDHATPFLKRTAICLSGNVLIPSCETSLITGKIFA